METKIIIPPNLSHLICSWDYARRLKKYEILQCTLFHYFEDENDVHGKHISAGQLLLPEESATGAFLATELIYAIGHGFPKPDLLHPTYMSRLQDEGTFGVYMVDAGKFFMNHADACADFLLQLIDAGATSVQDVNRRLNKFCFKETTAINRETSNKKDIQLFAVRMAMGKTGSPEDLQFYQNNKEEIEAELLLLKD